MDVKKANNYLQNLYAGIAMDVKNRQLFKTPIWGYYNGCKKISNYLRDLYVGIVYLKWPYGNYNRKGVGITQCSFWFLWTLKKLMWPIHMGLFKFWFLI